MAGQTFERRYVVHETTVPAGTLEATPITDPWDLGNRIVETVTVVVPPGHSTLTGVALDYDGVRILPFGGTDDWVITDNEYVPFDLDMEVGHPLDIRAFNTDVYAHTFHFRATIRELGSDVGERRAQSMIAL